MTVSEITRFLDARVPRSLSCAWDNDGLSCSPDPEREVRRVLTALDVTEETVEYAIRGNYDLLLTHHPLIFRPLKALEPSGNVPRKALKLACAGVSAIALHTRLDAFDGGVNDALAQALNFSVIGHFPCEDALMGRIVRLPEPMQLDDFAVLVRQRLGAEHLNLADAGRMVQTVGLLGGEGGDFIGAAQAAGCDTYLSGRIGYHVMLDAREMGINAIEAGHYATEAPVCARLASLILEVDPTLTVDIHVENALCSSSK